MLSKSPFALILALALGATNAAVVKFYLTTSCDGPASFELRDVCNHCYDPPGDWMAVQFSEIDANQRVSVHKQNKCTTASAAGQRFGPICFFATQNPFRSAWVACDGQRLDLHNSTELNNFTIPTVEVPDDE